MLRINTIFKGLFLTLIFIFIFPLFFNSKIFAVVCPANYLSCKVTDINNDSKTDYLDLALMSTCYNSNRWTISWSTCGKTDVNRDGKIDATDQSLFSGCYRQDYSSCPAVITPAPLPPVQIFVSGYVKDVNGRGVAGARVQVHKTDSKYGPCVGQHWGCSPEVVTTDSAGKWTSACIDGPALSIFIKKVQNPAGFIDANRFPDASGGSAWDKNTVCFGNSINKTNFGPVSFYVNK